MLKRLKSKLLGWGGAPKNKTKSNRPVEEARSSQPARSSTNDSCEAGCSSPASPAVSLDDVAHLKDSFPAVPLCADQLAPLTQAESQTGSRGPRSIASSTTASTATTSSSGGVHAARPGSVRSSWVPAFSVACSLGQRHRQEDSWSSAIDLIRWRQHHQTDEDEDHDRLTITPTRPPNPAEPGTPQQSIPSDACSMSAHAGPHASPSEAHTHKASSSTTINSWAPPQAPGTERPVHFFAVFDGHGGPGVAQHCSRVLHEHVRTAIATCPFHSHSLSSTHQPLPGEDLAHPPLEGPYVDCASHPTLPTHMQPPCSPTDGLLADLRVSSGITSFRGSSTLSLESGSTTNSFLMGGPSRLLMTEPSGSTAPPGSTLVPRQPALVISNTASYQQGLNPYTTTGSGIPIPTLSDRPGGSSDTGVLRTPRAGAHHVDASSLGPRVGSPGPATLHGTPYAHAILSPSQSVMSGQVMESPGPSSSRFSRPSSRPQAEIEHAGSPSVSLLGSTMQHPLGEFRHSSVGGSIVSTRTSAHSTLAPSGMDPYPSPSTSEAQHTYRHGAETVWPSGRPASTGVMTADGTSAGTQTTPLSSIGDLHVEARKQTSSCAAPCVEAALVHAFLQTDAELAASGVGAQDQGSTAVVALLGPDHLWIANTGDSRAVLCRDGDAVVMSSDHKACRQDEISRVRAAGGHVWWNRVMGELAISRAIGDHCLRPYVIAEPEVTRVTRRAGDQLLILASDGLWDVITNQEACDIALATVQAYHRKGRGASSCVRKAASALTKAALARGSRDNITVLVVDMRKPPSYVAPPLHPSSVHDAPAAEEASGDADTARGSPSNPNSNTAGAVAESTSRIQAAIQRSHSPPSPPESSPALSLSATTTNPGLIEPRLRHSSQRSSVHPLSAPIVPSAELGMSQIMFEISTSNHGIIKTKSVGVPNLISRPSVSISQRLQEYGTPRPDPSMPGQADASSSNSDQLPTGLALQRFMSQYVASRGAQRARQPMVPSVFPLACPADPLDTPPGDTLDLMSGMLDFDKEVAQGSERRMEQTSGMPAQL